MLSDMSSQVTQCFVRIATKDYCPLSHDLRTVDFTTGLVSVATRTLTRDFTFILTLSKWITTWVPRGRWRHRCLQDWRHRQIADVS